MRFAIVDEAGTVLNVLELDAYPSPGEIVEGGRAILLEDGLAVELDGMFDEDDSYRPPVKVIEVGAGAKLFAVVDATSRVVLNVVRATEDWAAPAGSTLYEDTGQGVAIGGSIAPNGAYTPPYQEPPPPAAAEPPRLRVVGVLSVDGDGGVSGIETSLCIGWAMEFEPGVYWIGLEASLTNPAIPAPGCSPGECVATVASQDTDFLEMHVRDRASGELVRPTSLSFVAYC